MMETILFVLLIILMASVAFVLMRGIFTMGGSGVETRRKSNRLMRWRIGLQLGAVIIIALLIMMSQSG